MAVDQETRQRFAFFLENAGYATPPRRAACALALARAEAELQDLVDIDAARVEWHDDDYIDPDDEQAARAARGEIVGPYGCVVVVAPGTVAEKEASCWGIFLAHDDDPYRRVMEAELASEVLS